MAVLKLSIGGVWYEISVGEAASILAALQTVDGVGSGLDADLLDGEQGTHFLARASHTGTQTASTISDFATGVSSNAAVTANTAKVSYTDAAAVAANTAKTSYTDGATVAAHTVELAARTTTLSQATAPASTADLWFHTTDLELYAYDSTRSEWLSTVERSIVFNYYALTATTSTTTTLRTGEVTSYGIIKSGWPCPFNLKVTGYEWRNRYDNVGHRIRLAITYADATYVNSYYPVYPAGTHNTFGEHDLDLDYSQQDAIGALTATGTGSSQTQYQTLTVTYRRRPS